MSNDRAIQVGSRNRISVKPHELEHQEEVKKIVKKLSDLVNVMGSTRYLVPAFAEAFEKEHRTLQADMVTVLLQGLSEWAQNAVKDKRIDARNEFAVKAVLEQIDGDSSYFTC
jgi:hypothetical protein